MELGTIGGFNTTLQAVDDGLDWINDMVKARQELLSRYMGIIKLESYGGSAWLNTPPTIDSASGSSLGSSAASTSDSHLYGHLDDQWDDLPEQQARLRQAKSNHINTFCDYLVDYISQGQFDLYPKIVSLLEHASARTLSIVHRVLPKIEDNTYHLLRLCDRYSAVWDDKTEDSLRSDLSSIGVLLEQRFRNEDRLIISLKLLRSR